MKALEKKREVAGKDKENLEELGLHGMSWAKEAFVNLLPMY